MSNSQNAKNKNEGTNVLTKIIIKKIMASGRSEGWHNLSDTYYWEN